MTLTQDRIIGAYRAVHELTGAVLPYRASRSIAALKKRLSEEIDVISDMERAVVDRHGGNPDNGAYKFDSPEAAAACDGELRALRAQEDDIELPDVDLSEYTGQLRLSANALEALEGLVIFGED